MENLDEKIKKDIDSLLMIAKPRLDEAYKSGASKLYDEVSQEFIFVAHGIFMHLYENLTIEWFAAKMLGSNLCKPSFWRYTDLVHRFCDYLKEVTSASATRTCAI